jgi:hypothetical protein
MAVAVCVTQTGGPDVLKLVQVDEDKPGRGEVWLEQEAVGVNYLDVTQRNGAVPMPLPSRLGLQGAEHVAAVGEDVEPTTCSPPWRRESSSPLFGKAIRLRPSGKLTQPLKADDRRARSC